MSYLDLIVFSRTFWESRVKVKMSKVACGVLFWSWHIWMWCGYLAGPQRSCRPADSINSVSVHVKDAAWHISFLRFPSETNPWVSSASSGHLERPCRQMILSHLLQNPHIANVSSSWPVRKDCSNSGRIYTGWNCQNFLGRHLNLITAKIMVNKPNVPCDWKKIGNI